MLYNIVKRVDFIVKFKGKKIYEVSVMVRNSALFHTCQFMWREKGLAC